MSSPFFPADVLHLELDINRMAAVVQTVVRKDGKLYGALRFRAPPGCVLTRPNSGERLPEEWDCRGILICFNSTSNIVYDVHICKSGQDHWGYPYRRRT